MVQSTAAVFQKGVLKPLEPLEGIPEDTVVRITVETPVSLTREETLAILRAVPVAEELASVIEAGRRKRK